MVANTVGSAKDLANSLLDKGYTDATEQVMRALLRNHTTGIMQQRLDEFQAEAQRLANEGKKMTADNAVFRALMADFEATLKRDAGMVDGASGDVQAAGVDAGGVLARQLSLPGMTDAQLAAIGIQWNRPDPEAINSVVNYINGEAWWDELNGFGDDVMDAALNVVLGGIAEGKSPLATARDLQTLNDTLPLWKANNILRTLQLTGYRDSTSLYYTANADIITEIVRIGTLDGRICLCCLALHGTKLAVGERVDDHHQGRCTSIGIVKGREWNVQTGEAYWDGLSESEQMALAGYANYQALKGGAVKLQDFVQPYTDPVFGAMVREASLKGILGTAAQDYYKVNQNKPPTGGTIATPDGMMPRDTGKPGNTEASLTAFLNASQGPLAQALRQNEFGIVQEDWTTGQWTVEPQNVKDAARQYVVESQNIQYGRDYILSLVQAEAARNGVTVDLKGAADLYNRMYGYQAQAIQTAAAIGNVRLTDAQQRRLETAAGGNYLSMVYTTQSSVSGSLANATRRTPSAGGGSANMTDAARRERRREFLDMLGQLD